MAEKQTSLKDLMAQREALDSQIQELQTRSRSEAIEQIRALMDENGLTPRDLAGPASARKNAGSGARKPLGKVAPKYKNSSTGETWTGRGLQPNWLKTAIASGKKLDDFAIKG